MATGLRCPYCYQRVSGDEADHGECGNCGRDIDVEVRKPVKKSGARGSKKKRGQVGKGISRSGRKKAVQPKREKAGHSTVVYTDGSCRHNGCGGWAWAYHDKDGHIIHGKGRTADTTNNRMELTAIVEAMEHFSTPTNLTIVSDSQYCVKGSQSWMYKWETNNWKRSVHGNPVKNPELWKRVMELTRFHDSVSFLWVRGHNGDPMNEFCDRIASDESQNC